VAIASYVYVFCICKSVIEVAETIAFTKYHMKKSTG
jgi:hypothetical protein